MSPGYLCPSELPRRLPTDGASSSCLSALFRSELFLAGVSSAYAAKACFRCCEDEEANGLFDEKVDWLGLAEPGGVG